MPRYARSQKHNHQEKLGHYLSPHSLTQRQLRVGEVLRRELAPLLSGHFLNEEILSHRSFSVNEIKVSPDLMHAIVYVTPTSSNSSMIGHIDNETIDSIIHALNKASGFLRYTLTKKVYLKRIPKFKFVYDQSFDIAERITQKLDSIRIHDEKQSTPKQYK
ncbi:MAG: 30S ribosome-binding factor RbfA [Pseudomonadota bacterium]